MLALCHPPEHELWEHMPFRVCPAYHHVSKSWNREGLLLNTQKVSLRGAERPQAHQLYLLPRCGAALRTLHRAPVGASVILGHTPAHVHTVI